jgi:hypothetical protein
LDELKDPHCADALETHTVPRKMSPRVAMIDVLNIVLIRCPRLPETTIHSADPKPSLKFNPVRTTTL